MQTFERWQVVREQDGWRIVLDQKRQAWVNVAVGVAIVWLASWLRSQPDYGGLGLGLMAFGALWVLGALAATREQRAVRITRRTIVLERGKGRTADQWPIERIDRVQIERKRKKKSGNAAPLPWRVRILDAAGGRFRGKFKFQAEAAARAFAEDVARMLGVRVEQQVGRHERAASEDRSAAPA